MRDNFSAECVTSLFGEPVLFRFFCVFCVLCLLCHGFVLRAHRHCERCFFRGRICRFTSGYVRHVQFSNACNTSIASSLLQQFAFGPMFLVLCVFSYLQVATPEFKQYSIQVKANARTLAEHMMADGYKLMTSGVSL